MYFLANGGQYFAEGVEALQLSFSIDCAPERLCVSALQVPVDELSVLRGEEFEAEVAVAFEFIAIELLHDERPALRPVGRVLYLCDHPPQLLVVLHFGDTTPQSGIVAARRLECSCHGGEKEALIVHPTWVVDTEKLIVPAELDYWRRLNF